MLSVRRTILSTWTSSNGDATILCMKAPEDYREAALERLGASQAIYRKDRHSECIYLSGLAVECILRAYITRRKAEYSDKHDLPSLFRTSQMHHGLPADRRSALSADLVEVWSRWRNSYRYAPSSRILVEYKRRRIDLKARGDQLKYSASRILASAGAIVGTGVARWKKK